MVHRAMENADTSLGFISRFETEENCAACLVFGGTYVGGKKRISTTTSVDGVFRAEALRQKPYIIGAVERGGKARAGKAERTNKATILAFA